jgi:predicted nucleic acid-binding Zn ribbon protein
MQNLHDMQPVGAELERIVARSVRKAAPGEGPLLAWPLVCGSAVAERTRALDFAGGVLRVEVADAGWRTELQTLAPRYVAVLNKYVAENVARVEFVITPRK